MSDTFRDITDRIAAKVATRSRTVFANTASHALESVVSGSPVTGAPGQPVDTGALRASWQLGFPDENTAIITTDSPYARQNEDGIARPGGGPYIQRSPVGGRYSIRLTVAGINRILAFEAAKVTGRG